MDRKKYNYMEDTLKHINSFYIALDPDDIHVHNGIIIKILNTVVGLMRDLDPLFKVLYKRTFYGGSFYDNLKVNNPDEFDMDLLFVLPKCKKCWFSCDCITLQNSKIPGFVNVRLNNEYYQKNRFTLERLVNENRYLSSSKTRSWMISLVHRTLNFLKDNNNELPYQVTYRTSGPAVTLVINGTLDVDLVPAFLFGKGMWPKDGFRKNPFQEDTDFFIIPKSPRSTNYYASICWRLSFQIQERLILSNSHRLKPTVRLLKKMRDTLQHHYISSYYLKTIALWAVYEKSDDRFWSDNSLSYIFIWMLKRYRDHLKKGEIPYFWNKRNNLLENIHKSTLENDCNRVNRVLCNIENNHGDQRIVAHLLLPPREYQELVGHGCIPKSLRYNANEEKTSVWEFLLICFLVWVIYCFSSSGNKDA